MNRMEDIPPWDDKLILKKVFNKFMADSFEDDTPIPPEEDYWFGEYWYEEDEDRR